MNLIVKEISDSGALSHWERERVRAKRLQEAET